MTDEHPTEQFPAQPPQPSGAVPKNRPPLLKRTGVPTALGVIGGLVVGCGVTYGGLAAAGAFAPGHGGHGPHAGEHGGRAHHAKAAGKRGGGAVGQIAAESGDTWTVKTRAGKTVQVHITSNTKFGTVEKPQTRDQFTVGSDVAVRAHRTNGTIDAVRVVKVQVPSAGPTSAPPANQPPAAPSTP